MTAYAATTREAVTTLLASMRADYCCVQCLEQEPCEHTAGLGVEAGDDVAILLAAVTDLMPHLTDAAVAVLADRLLGESA